MAAGAAALGGPPAIPIRPYRSVSTKALDTKNLVRYDRTRTTLRQLPGIGTLFGSIIVLATWLAFHRGLQPSWPIWPADGLVALFAAGLLYFVGVAMVPYGVRVEDQGVLRYETAPNPRKVFEVLYHWDELRDPKLAGRGGDVMFTTDTIVMTLPAPLAKVVLSDPRYPYRERIPSDVSKRIGLTG